MKQTLDRLDAFLAGVWPWVVAHPVFASLIFWPVITALVTWLFKKRTPEEFAEMAKESPRKAQFLRLIGALGIDVPKVLQVLGDIVNSVPKGMGVVLFLSAAVAFSATACKPGQTPRETGRATVLVVADAVKQLDALCAALARAKQDAALGQSCADGYDVARASLISAEAALDAYDSVGAGNLPCAVAHSVTAMQGMVDSIRKAGGSTPPVVDDAFALAPLLTGACRG